MILSFDNKKEILKWATAIRNSLTVSPILSMASFRILSTIGRGFFGKVMLVQHRTTGELFAIKSIQKKRLIETRKLHTVVAERSILLKAKHPFLVRLCFSFQTSSKFYLGLEYAAGGELYYHMEKRGKIPVEEARLYLAEIALAIDYLHSIGIIYRDLKPENILLDGDGHIKLTDFGLSKEVENNNTTSTICGTTEYLAPEMILRQPYTYSIDWWSLGILTYEMLTEGNPFLGDNRGKTLQNIVKAVPQFPPGMPDDAIELTKALLTKDPKLRPGFSKIKKMKFFSSLNWEDVYNKKYTPLFIPESVGNIAANFDPEFTTENPVDSAVQSASCNFPDFSYTGLPIDERNQSINFF